MMLLPSSGACGYAHHLSNCAAQATRRSKARATARRVTTDAGSYDADFLVVAMGADYDMDATPGLEAGGFEYYTVAGTERLPNSLAAVAPAGLHAHNTRLVIRLEFAHILAVRHARS